MLIAFDPAKDAVNLAKHGLSLALAADLEGTARWSGWMAARNTERRANAHWHPLDSGCTLWPSLIAAIPAALLACAKPIFER